MINPSVMLELMKDYDGLHSSFQIDHYIIGRSGGTVYGKYKQALRELHGRWESLKQEYYDYQMLEIDLEELEAKRMGAAYRTAGTPREDPYERRRDALRALKVRMDRETHLKRLESLTREFGRFYAHATALRDHLGSELQDVDKLEEGHRLFLLRRDIAVTLRSGGRVSGHTLEAIWALPLPLREGLLDDLRSPEKLLHWLERHEEPIVEIQEPTGLTFEAVRGLLL